MQENNNCERKGNRSPDSKILRLLGLWRVSVFKRYFWGYVSGVIESIRDEIMLKVAVVNMMFVGGV